MFETRVGAKLAMAMAVEMATSDPERLQRIADVLHVMRRDTTDLRPRDQREMATASEFVASLLTRHASGAT